MKNKKLYYTVNLLGEGLGMKRITVYEIIKKELKIFCEIETYLNTNDENEIQVYLDNNGYEDEEFVFVKL